jgi:hypothetical protein
VRDLICGMLADPVTRAAMAKVAPVASPGSASDALADLQLRRERLIDLYTDGDIDRATFRARQTKLDDQIRAVERGVAGGSGPEAMPTIPSTFDELVTTWDESGIEFQRRLVEILLQPIMVNPAGARRKIFDPERLAVTPTA